MKNPSVLGVDIGGTNTKLGLVTPDGTVRLSDKIPTDAKGESPEPFFNQRFDLIPERL